MDLFMGGFPYRQKNKANNAKNFGDQDTPNQNAIIAIFQSIVALRKGA
jgi:hypothetical protein